MSGFITELSLSRPVYDALRTIDLKRVDPETRFYVKKTLRAFRLVGVIAKDLFSTFDRTRLLEPGVATRYRTLVLAPGGSKPAADIVRGYLGRPFNFDAWRRWLDAEPAPPAAAP